MIPDEVMKELGPYIETQIVRALEMAAYALPVERLKTPQDAHDWLIGYAQNNTKFDREVEHHARKVTLAKQEIQDRINKEHGR